MLHTKAQSSNSTGLICCGFVANFFVKHVNNKLSQRSLRLMVHVCAWWIHSLSCSVTVCSAIQSTWHEAASRGPLALADILVKFSSKVSYQQLSCVLKSVALITVALATLKEMLSADLHNHEHWMAQLPASLQHPHHGYMPHVASWHDYNFLISEIVPRSSDLTSTFVCYQHKKILPFDINYRMQLPPPYKNLIIFRVI